MTTVALFRNLNLGHPGSPSRHELLDAFGGATVARNFQTNGTVIVKAGTHLDLVLQAATTLRGAGYEHSLVVRSIDEIRRAAERAASFTPAADVYRVMVSFFDAPTVPDLRTPLRSSDRLVEVRDLRAASATSFCWKVRSNTGDVTTFVESLVSAPTTTRTLGTLQRLLRTAERADP